MVPSCWWYHENGICTVRLKWGGLGTSSYTWHIILDMAPIIYWMDVDIKTSLTSISFTVVNLTQMTKVVNSELPSWERSAYNAKIVNGDLTDQ